MSFDPNKWRESFSEGSIHRFVPCGQCGEYKVEGEESIRSSQTTASAEEWSLAAAGEGPGPHDIEERFVALLKCGACGESIVIAGNKSGEVAVVRTGPEPDDFDDEMQYTLFPKLIEPPPNLFPIPRDAPLRVHVALRTAFRLYWTDRDACVSRLRMAVERFLDSENIPSRRGNDAPIFLSKRLLEYEEQKPSIAKKLEAVKWLGDTGAHELGKLNLLSVNDGLKLICAALEERYEGDKLMGIADAIINKKGPRTDTGNL